MGGKNSKVKKAEPVTESPGGSHPGDSVRGFSQTAFDKPDWALDKMANDSTKAMFLSTLHEAKIKSVLATISSIDYGMFWKKNAHGELVWETSATRTSDQGVMSFVEISRHCIFREGQSLVGSCAAEGADKWLANCTQMPTTLFERNSDAQLSGINTVFCLPIDGGVVEFGMKASAGEDKNIIAQAKALFAAKVEASTMAGVKAWSNVYDDSR